MSLISEIISNFDTVVAPRDEVGHVIIFGIDLSKSGRELSRTHYVEKLLQQLEHVRVLGSLFL